MPIIVENARRWKKIEMGVRRSSIWAARRLIYFMSGRSTASRSDSDSCALAGARRTFVSGFLTECARLSNLAAVVLFTSRRWREGGAYVLPSFPGRPRETTVQRTSPRYLSREPRSDAYRGPDSPFRERADRGKFERRQHNMLIGTAVTRSLRARTTTLSHDTDLEL